MLKTEWHQKFPYNSLCPTENNYNTVVGCAAVAMGQICAYKRKPQQLNNHTYDWDTMLAQSGHSTVNDTGIYDISHLLRNIGELVKMDYGLESSSATTGNALEGFKTMGYSKAEIKIYSIGDVTASIAINNPVWMRGTNPSDGEGHAWVVDGYDMVRTWTEYYDKETGNLFASYGGSNVYTYLHFNVGWSDSDNNAYYLCQGAGNRSDGKLFSIFEYTQNNKIITNLY